MIWNKHVFSFTYFIMKSCHGWLVKTLAYPRHEYQGSIHATNITYVHIVYVCVYICTTIHKFHIKKNGQYINMIIIININVIDI
jgi:hypothetical protein